MDERKRKPHYGWWIFFVQIFAAFAQYSTIYWAAISELQSTDEELDRAMYDCYCGSSDSL